MQAVMHGPATLHLRCNSQYAADVRSDSAGGATTSIGYVNARDAEAELGAS